LWSGGGGIWLETKKREKFSDLSIQQTLDIGVNVSVVLYTYCRLNFKDGILTIGKEGAIKAKSTSELVQEVL